MHITICFHKLDPKPWVQGLQRAFPSAEVSAWVPGAPPADHAIVWAPPQRFIDEQAGLQMGQGASLALRDGDRQAGLAELDFLELVV